MTSRKSRLDLVRLSRHARFTLAPFAFQKTPFAFDSIHTPFAFDSKKQRRTQPTPTHPPCSDRRARERVAGKQKAFLLASGRPALRSAARPRRTVRALALLSFFFKRFFFFHSRQLREHYRKLKEKQDRNQGEAERPSTATLAELTLLSERAFSFFVTCWLTESGQATTTTSTCERRPRQPWTPTCRRAWRAWVCKSPTT